MQPLLLHYYLCHNKRQWFLQEREKRDRLCQSRMFLPIGQSRFSKRTSAKVAVSISWNVQIENRTTWICSNISEKRFRQRSDIFRISLHYLEADWLVLTDPVFCSIVSKIAQYLLLKQLPYSQRRFVHWLKAINWSLVDAKIEARQKELCKNRKIIQHGTLLTGCSHWRRSSLISLFIKKILHIFHWTQERGGSNWRIFFHDKGMAGSICSMQSFNT